ncbi:MAG: glycosyl transferase family protein [Acidimicrobiia bacterium]|nr:glycosyl transferase family protein [Acidimicrobiia bacterium]
MDSLYSFQAWADGLAAGLIVPLAVWIILSGLDDLVILAAFLLRPVLEIWRRPLLPVPSRHMLASLSQRRVAIFVPLWQEAAVIADMLEHNIAAIRYGNYDFFVGAYPNDPDTQRAVQRVADRHANVHLCLTPHDGSTSKADCLNWIYQRMLQFELQTGRQYQIILTHDAEDIIHPFSIAAANYYTRCYDMVQMPVLPLPTPWSWFTHGLYCDDFAEFHTKDMVARGLMGGFIPSSGVGTAYTRRALEKLAEAESNRVFQPECLTEDYENGLRLHELGCAQFFVPIRWMQGRAMAIREFFPQQFRAARRQRARWVTGIAMQSWQRHGWRGPWARRYWLWRDRKGLLGNPLSLAANLLFGYGLLSAALSWASGRTWLLGLEITHYQQLVIGSASLGVINLAARTACSARVYGWRFATGAPLRSLHGNLLNSLATFSAALRYLRALWLRQPLVWVKTEHAYPSLASLTEHKRRLGEILVGAGYLAPQQLASALGRQPANRRLGEHLVDLGLLSEEQLLEALSIQHGIPARRVDPAEVPLEIARTLPARITRDLRMLAIALEGGTLELATPDLPTDEAQARLREFTRLGLRFTLVSPSNYEQLSRKLL